LRRQCWPGCNKPVARQRAKVRSLTPSWSWASLAGLITTSRHQRWIEGFLADTAAA
jgi:hypothetical protein